MTPPQARMPQAAIDELKARLGATALELDRKTPAKIQHAIADTGRRCNALKAVASAQACDAAMLSKKGVLAKFGSRQGLLTALSSLLFDSLRLLHSAKRAATSRILSLGENPRTTVSPSVPTPLSLEVDANGSPVTVAQADWLVCFVPGLQRQWWHRFADARHKHVFAMRPLSDDTWLLFEPWWRRLMVNVLSFDEAVKFLKWGAAGDILQVQEAIPGCGSQARGWSNCAVLVSFLLGRSYRTWTPNGLFRRLQAEPETQIVDLAKLLPAHFNVVMRQSKDDQELPEPEALSIRRLSREPAGS